MAKIGSNDGLGVGPEIGEKMTRTQLIACTAEVLPEGLGDVRAIDFLQEFQKMIDEYSSGVRDVVCKVNCIRPEAFG